MRIELKYQRGTQSKTITVRANSTREAIEMVYRRITEAGISAVRTRSLILIQDASTGLYATIGRNEIK